MLEKLRDNPRAVVAALIAAGVIAIVIGAGNQDSNSGDTQSENTTPEIVLQEDEAVSDEATDEASESSESNALESVPQEGPVDVASEEGSLKATVRNGDNQTVIVRQMVEAYASSNSEVLSAEQKLYAETNIVNNLPKNDVIHPGEEVSVEESVVADIVQKSKDLDEGQIALWSAYL